MSDVRQQKQKMKNLKKIRAPVCLTSGQLNQGLLLRNYKSEAKNQLGSYIKSDVSLSHLVFSLYAPYWSNKVSIAIPAKETNPSPS